MSKFQNPKSLNSQNRGFTLIELVVVLGLFMLIMGVVVNIFISIVQHQKRILGQQEILSQTSYVQDYILRSLRDAKTDTRGSCLTQDGVVYKEYVYLLTHLDIETGGYQGVKFISKENICQEFFLDGDGVLKEIKNGQPSQNMLSSKFKIKYSRFIINGNKNVRAVLGSDAMQPRISISLNIKDPSYENSPEMIIQTTISHRD